MKVPGSTDRRVVRISATAKGKRILEEGRDRRIAVIAESLSGAKRTALETFSRLVVLAVAFCLIWFGYLNFLDGFRSLRMPSMTPLASLYAGIPFCGVLVALFTIEQLVNGWRHGFEDRE